MVGSQAMRQIIVSTEVFSLLWAARQPGEESENDILLRVLSKVPSPVDESVGEPKKMNQLDWKSVV